MHVSDSDSGSDVDLFETGQRQRVLRGPQQDKSLRRRVTDALNCGAIFLTACHVVK